MSTKWFRVIGIAWMIAVFVALLFINDATWDRYFASQQTGSPPSYQWFAERRICDGRPGQLGWSTTDPDGTILWCADNGALFKDGQPGKFSWWVNDWKLYRQRRLLGWWPVKWLELPWWWDSLVGWIPCIFSGPTNCK